MPSTRRPGSSAWRPARPYDSNPNAMQSFGKAPSYTNVALTDDGDVWWEGIGRSHARSPDRLEGQRLDARLRRRRRRTRTPVSPLRRSARSIALEWEDPQRRADRRDPRRRPPRPATIPLVHESFDWAHGVFLGSVMGSEITAGHHLRQDRPGAPRPVRDAAVHRLPRLRLPAALAGYRRDASTEDKLPKIFYVNWFRKDGRPLAVAGVR
jgi:phosphoenolpyruvate carboxykinase (GTP)